MGNQQEEWIYCPNCGVQNRPGARFCRACAAPLPEIIVEEDRPSGIDQIVDDVFNEISDLWRSVKKGLSGRLGPNPPATPVLPTNPTVPLSAPPARPGRGRGRPAIALRPIRPLNRGAKFGYLYITEVIPVPNDQHLMYYEARWLNCPSCNTPVANIQAPQCAKCHAALNDLLLRQSGAAVLMGEQGMEARLRTMSLRGELPGVLPHHTWFVVPEDQLVYTALNRPELLWQPLSSVQPPQPAEIVIHGFRKLAETLDLLHQQGFVLFDDRRPDYHRDSFIITSDQAVLLTDLTSCRPILASPDPSAEVKRDIRAFARLVCFLLTGQGMTGNLMGVPAEMRRVFENVRYGNCSSAKEFLADLERAPQPQPLARGLRQAMGYATDIGVSREANEDFVGHYSFGLEQAPGAEQIGLYIIADGMGGHAAGERASQDVVRVIVEKIHEQKLAPDLRRSTRLLDQAVTNQDVLARAISRANEILFEARKTGGSDRGTTLTSAFIAGSTATIANIGDSRTYLFRTGKLEQVTRDHSLVASLVAAGQISKEDARRHPNRNQVYRTLGDKQKVDPDFFTVNLLPDDMLMLCSDGLWEMITDPVIQNILAHAPSPQKACDELIRSANAAGGEDNISVIVIKIE